MEDLAWCAHAVYDQPFFQGVDTCNGWRDGCLAYPSYFMFFTYFKRVVSADPYEPLKENHEIGDDIMRDMIGFDDIPHWPYNDKGNANVPMISRITTKPIAWTKWPNNMFQTCVWLGSSTPSYNSQRSWQRNGGKGGEGGKGGKVMARSYDGASR
jgi:hypothetical protein